MTPARFLTAVRVSRSIGKHRPPCPFQSRFYSSPQPQPQSPPKRSVGPIFCLAAEKRSPFGIAFDIDGVILRGRVPVGGSPRALRKLYGASGTLKVVQGHTPFKTLLKRYENDFIIAVGKGEPANVMSEYGFKKVLSLDDYASYFKNIDPVSQYKMWKTRSNLPKEPAPRDDVYSDRVNAAFVLSDPVDWGRDIQVLCDILRSGGLPGLENGHQPPLYFAADDLEYQAAFPSERLGMGAFRIALESIFNRIHKDPLEYVTFGKPNPFVFKNAEILLTQLQPSHCDNDITNTADSQSHSFKTLYMIGDNPFVDVKGARQAGHPWFSILTRTGVFKGNDNHGEFPADLVVDTVEEAVDYILKTEGTY